MKMMERVGGKHGPHAVTRDASEDTAGGGVIALTSHPQNRGCQNMLAVLQEEFRQNGMVRG